MSLSRTPEPEVMDTVEEAVDYDSMDHSTVNRTFVQDLLQYAAQIGTEVRLQEQFFPVGAVIDVGVGTALIPLELVRSAPHVGPIMAIDMSVEMLRLAVGHVRRGQVEQRILPVLADAKRMPLADASCAAVISNSIIHHIPEPLVVFREVRRIIRPGGIVFLRDLMRPESPEAVEQLVVAYAGDENVRQQQLFRQSLHAALTVDEVRELLDKADLSCARVAATSDRHWTVTARPPKF